jgi:hypothetical protein
MSRHVPMASLPLFESAARDRERQFSRLPEPVFVIAPTTPLEVQFARFHERNPQVFRALVNRAEQMLSEGKPRIGIAKLFEDVRDDPEIRTRGDAFKLNNNHRAFYARKLIDYDPRFKDVIKTRVQTHTRKKEGATA